MTNANKQPIKLYYAPDNASLIVRLLMEELDLAYETILVDRRVNEQKSEHYLRLNPDGLIPVCIINDEPVFETAAILLSLADSNSGVDSSSIGTVSVSDTRRPQFLKYLFFLSSSLHGDLIQRFYPQKYVGQHSQAQRLFADVALQRVHRRFSLFNDAYTEAATDYLFDDAPCIIDIYLAVCFRWAQLYPVDGCADFCAADFAAIINMAEKLEQRPAIRHGCAKEGISGLFFSQPDYAMPPEGVAL